MNEPKQSDTPETDAEVTKDRPQRLGTDHHFKDWQDSYRDLIELARKLERERDEAMVPLCVGQPIIQILAEEGCYRSDNGRGIIAADCLFRKDPYKEIAQLRARVAELEKDKERLLLEGDNYQ